MCSSMLLVVQSTIVAASIVRGSAPRPTTISLVLTRSCPKAGPVTPATPTRARTTAASPRVLLMSLSPGDGLTRDRSVARDGRARGRIAGPGWPKTNRRRSMASSRSDAQLRVERVAQPVADQVDAERGERERRPWEGRQPPGDVEEIAALAQHATPGRGRWLDAEAEEADGSLGHDEL